MPSAWPEIINQKSRRKLRSANRKTCWAVTTKEQYEILIEKMHILMTEHHSSSSGARLQQLLDNLNSNSKNHYLEYSEKDDEWIAIDTMAEVRKAHDAQNESSD